ncbi:thioredoxin-like protein [Coniella lustricola]|uniref:Thioredoxin-like protein n=1 Tax=Coniella lustricola TaxID=2025994 RepID=A0A2T3A434_9PEZI|nr:thioredoxin-like protein [Coniella lustricola]
MSASLKLYTNHRCPWAHRAHITLAELGVPYEEEIIDLDTPRTPEYLAINPRGLVPSLSYNGTVITESAIVAQFLADTYPDRAALAPPTTDPRGPLVRARIAFFVDAWFSKVNGLYNKALNAGGDGGELVVAAIKKEIEPLLEGAAPFFGGSEKLTMAEVLTGPFVLRLRTFLRRGLLPAQLGEALAEQTPNFYKWSDAVIASKSVTGIFNEDAVVTRTLERIAKAKA